MAAYNIKTDSAYAANPDEAANRLKDALLQEIRRSCFVYRVDCGGCNGCEIEIFASITPVFDAERFGVKVVSSPRHADVLVFTGAMTRAMRVPALRAYHAAPDPKICVAYGACGCSGGIFHDLYGVWGGADKILPIDLYIPGCPPTPAATLHGFAVALGLLSQKIKAVEHIQAPDEQAALPLPNTPLHLRVAIEREARRMAGYWSGMRLAEAFLGLIHPTDSDATHRILEVFLQIDGDPRQAEIFSHLERVYCDHLHRGPR